MNILKMKLKDMSIVLVSHIYATGPAQELESYLTIEKVKKLFFIGHPFSFSGDIRSFYRLHEKGHKKKSGEAYPWKLPEVMVYIKDVLYTLLWLMTGKEKYDLYIGVDNLNAFTGILLRRIGRVKKVFFYTIDYIPKRFENNFLNSLYHWIDSFCIRHCDQVWNLSPVMVTEREKKGVPKRYRDKQITVPVGADLNVEKHPFENIDRYAIAFIGHLREGHGIDFLINVFPDIIKGVPKAKLLIIGSGPLEEQLKVHATKLRLNDHVEFAGFIENHREAQNRLSKCAIGIAPYSDDDKTYTRYTDPGKPKAYLAAGLPVIITKVPQIAFEIEKRKAGIAVNYDKNEVVKAVVSLLSDEERLIEYKKNALDFASGFEWSIIFKDAFRKSDIYI